MKSIAVLATAFAVLLGAAGPVHASCLPQPALSKSLAGSSVAFTGTVTAVEGGGRVATVLVDEVWKGGPLPAEVKVHGSPSEGAVTSVDRMYRRGDKYLFVPVNDASPFRDNICTATQEYSPALESSRPGASPDYSQEPVAPQPARIPHPGPSQRAKALIFALAFAAALAAGRAMRGGSKAG